MGLYTKIDKQIDNYYEVVSINKSLSKQNFYLKVIVLLLLVFIVFLIMKRFINFSFYLCICDCGVFYLTYS